MKKNKTASPWILLSVLIIALDQLTKYLVQQNIAAHQTIKIFPFLNFILRFNDGAAFSFLGAQNGWQIYLLSGISIAVSLVLIIWLTRLARSEWWIAVPVSLVLGGALGNLIDRVRYGFVTDFIDFHVKNWHYATFNVADSAVCVGAAWLILRLIYESFTKGNL
ncbi:MAG: signal peptidase II [Gammaproteobacteria bacterium]|nr:signal peptidase II [Gammaproteobacteria bacterium]